MKSLARRLSRSPVKEGSAAMPAATSVASLAAENVECQRAWGVSLDQEWKLVQQLRDEIELEAGELQPEFDDFALRRFLRARKHNILKAKLMFLEQLKWRKGSGVDTVLTDFVFHEKDQFNLYYPEGFYGVDRQGRPIYVQQPGKIDTVELWKFTTLERCIRYHLQCQERYWRIIAPAAGIASGRVHEASLVIIDMEGVGVSTLTGEVRKIMSAIMQIDQDFYPELMWKCVLLNAPTTFRVIWSMVKYLIDARTQAKVEVLGSDYHERLLELVEPQHLMTCYGGSNLLPLSAEPGPWRDPEVLAELGKRRQQRLQELGKQAGMTFPPMPALAAAAAEEDKLAATAAGTAAASQTAAA